MSLKEEIFDFINDHLDEFRKKYSLSKIGLFGSIARGDENQNSDIDLLVEFDLKKNIYKFKEEIRILFKNRFNRDVDLCREKFIKPYIKNEILNEIIYVK